MAIIPFHEEEDLYSGPLSKLDGTVLAKHLGNETLCTGVYEDGLGRSVSSLLIFQNHEMCT
jgi:hypothetical protein